MFTALRNVLVEAASADRSARRSEGGQQERRTYYPLDMKMNSATSLSRSSTTAKYTRFGASGREEALIRDVRHCCRGDGAGGGFQHPTGFLLKTSLLLPTKEQTIE